MILKLGMKHGEELQKVYNNHEPGMTLAYFMTSQHGSPMYLNGGKLSNYHLKGKT